MKNKWIVNLTVTVFFIFFSVSIISFAGCNKEQSVDSQVSQEKLAQIISNSEATYQEYCSGCHGAVMEAFLDKDWRWGNSPDELYMTISGDRANGAMPAFGKSFSDQQIKNMVITIRHKIENIEDYEPKETDIESDIFEANDFSYKLDEVAVGFESPWGMVFLPNGDILVTDKSGELWCISGKEKTEIDCVPEIEFEGQGGLMDIELHPEFAINKIIYLSYAKLNGDNSDLATTVVSRFVLENNQLKNAEEIFEALPYYDTRHHYGSRIEFDNDGYIYITVGDRGEREINPQDLTLYPGKVHRIKDDGTIPDDNPFVDQTGVVKSIYTYGHRNPQGMIKNPWTGEIWTHEHGPRGGDEINVIKSGLNYGWPVISYGINYNGTVFTSKTEKEGMEQPLHYWVPSIAPSGMDFVRGDKYPGWEGDLLIGSLKYGYLNLCNISGDKVISEEKLMQGIGRVRNVKQGPDGYIYMAVEEPGKILKIVPVE